MLITMVGVANATVLGMVHALGKGGKGQRGKQGMRGWCRQKMEADGGLWRRGSMASTSAERSIMGTGTMLATWRWRQLTFGGYRTPAARRRG